MTILTPPAAFNLPSRVTLAPVSNTQSGGRSPLNGSEQTLRLAGQRWQASLAWEGLAQDEWRPLLGFLAALGGRAGRFTWSPGPWLPRRGAALPDPVSGPARILVGGQTGSVVRVTGLDGGIVARAGDIIGWLDPAGRPQLHMVTEDVAASDPGRTNAVPNPRGVNAVAGTPGTMPTGWARGSTPGLSFTTGVVADWDGLPAIELRWFGTPVASGTPTLVWFHGANDVAAAAARGQVWSGTAFVGLAAGSVANVSNMYLSVIERASGGAYVNEQASVFVPAAGARTAQRRSVVKSVVGATTTHVQLALGASFTAGQAVDITLRVACPQLERGRAPSPPILPAVGVVAAASRIQDVSIPVAPPIRRSPAADIALTLPPPIGENLQVWSENPFAAAYTLSANVTDQGPVTDPDGFVTARRLRNASGGTADVSFRATTAIVARPSTAYVISVFARRAAGALSEGRLLTVNELNSAAAVWTIQTAFRTATDLTAGWARYSLAFVTRADTDALLIDWAAGWTSGADIDLWGFQIERGTSPTPLIETGAAPVLADTPPAIWRLASDRSPVEIMRGLMAGHSLEIEEALV